MLITYHRPAKSTSLSSFTGAKSQMSASRGPQQQVEVTAKGELFEELRNLTVSLDRLELHPVTPLYTSSLGRGDTVTSTTTTTQMSHIIPGTSSKTRAS